MAGIFDFAKGSSAMTAGSKAATGGLGKLGDALKKMSSSADEAKNGLHQGRDAMGRFTAANTGALGPLGQMGEMLGGLGPYGAAAGAGIGLAVVASTALVGALVACSVAAISIVQQRSALLATFSALAGGASGGMRTLAIVDKLGISLPFATDQVAAWAQSLQSAGFQGAKLESAIKAVAAAQALMGDRGGASAEKLLKTLHEGGGAATKMMKAIQSGGPKSAKLLADMGLSTKDLASALGMTVAKFKSSTISAAAMQKAIEAALAKKGAGPLDELGMTFPVIIQKAKEGFSSLFEGLGPSVKPFMKAVRELFGTFTKGSPTMRALKPIVTEVFSTIFKYATIATKWVHAFVKEMFSGKNIAGTWKSIKSAIITIIGPLKEIFSNAKTLDGIKMIFKGIAYAIAAVAAIAFATAAAFAIFVGAVSYVVSSVGSIVGAIVGMASGALSALAGWASGAVSAAGDFISGLVSGISSGAGAVVDAVKAMASSALGAFKSILGIHSPSAVMAKMGDHFSAGTAQGIDKGSGKVQAAAARTGGAAAGSVGGAMGGGKRGGGGMSVTFAKDSIQINGAGKGAMQITEEMLARALERLLAKEGLTPT